MNRKLFSSVSCFLALAAVSVTGCRQDDDDMYSDQGDRDRDVRPAAGKTPIDDAMRSAKLRDGGVPDDVRSIILADLGDLPVTSADMRPTEAGGRLYRIVYIVEGETHQRWYDASGKRIEPPAARPAESIDPVAPSGEVPPVPPPDQPSGLPK